MIGKRGTNRKGQDGIALPTLLFIIIGIVAVVVIIIGFTTGFDFITNIFRGAPGKSLEVVVQSCTISAQSDLRTDYCLDLKQVEINGQNRYVTCSYLETNDYLGEVKLSCGALVLDGLKAAEYCANKKLKDSQFIEDKTCKDLIGAVKCVGEAGENGLNGTWVSRDKCVSPAVDKTSSVGQADREIDAAKDKICCVGLSA